MQGEVNAKPREVTLREASERAQNRMVFRSGSEGLDSVLGGGFRTGEMVEIFGASGTGKTQLGIQSAASAASAGHGCGYVDTEGQFRAEKLASICESRGLDSDKILPLVYVIRADNTAQQLGAVDIVSERIRGCRMVVVDTVTRNFTLELGGTRLVARRQTALGAYLNRLGRDACANDRAVLLLNRVASVGKDENARDVDIGGETIRHFVQKALRLQRRGAGVYATIEDGEGLGEVEMKITSRGLE